MTSKEALDISLGCIAEILTPENARHIANGDLPENARFELHFSVCCFAFKNIIEKQQTEINRIESELMQHLSKG